MRAAPASQDRAVTGGARLPHASADALVLRGGR